MKKILVLLSLLVFCVSAYAVDYRDHDAGTYSSYSAAHTACNAAAPASCSGVSGVYQYSVQAPDGVWDRYFYTGLDDGCPVGTEADPNTGECVEPVPPPECEKEPGEYAGSEFFPEYEEHHLYEYQACQGICEIVGASSWGLNDLHPDYPGGMQINYEYTGETCDSGSGGPGEPGVGDSVPPPPDSGPQTEPDTDGDGIPDSQDDDMDGDGTPNGQDDDTDGDGIPDADDPSPNGEQSGSAQTSTNCAIRPSCEGDAIQCAQLYETWRLRCENPMVEEMDENYQDELLNELEGEMVSVLDGVEGEYENALGEDAGIEMDSSWEQKIHDLFPSTSCSSLDFNVAGQGWTISCEDTQFLRDILGFFLGVCTCLAIYNIALSTAPGNRVAENGG